MNKSQLKNQNDVIRAISQSKIIIGSMSNTGLSINCNPVEHGSTIEARKEAKRLAAQFPGKMFVMLHVCGAELVPAATSQSY